MRELVDSVTPGRSVERLAHRAAVELPHVLSRHRRAGLVAGHRAELRALAGDRDRSEGERFIGGARGRQRGGAGQGQREEAGDGTDHRASFRWKDEDEAIAPIA
ncbi:hypothetical protein MASR1M6_29090 [Rubrivivax sp.]